MKDFNYDKVCSLKDIERHPMVTETSNEINLGQGLWVYLKPEFINPHMECGIIHEDSIAKLVDQLKYCQEKQLCLKNITASIQMKI